MKTDIHPEYNEVQVTCTCGNSFTTRSTATSLSVEICSQCHPFYTGKQKLMDTGGRVERFRRRAAAAQSKAPVEKSAEAGAGAAAPSPAPEAAAPEAPAAEAPAADAPAAE